MVAGRLLFMEAVRRRELRFVAFGERPSLHGPTVAVMIVASGR